jgi:RNA polymerase sigma factor (sigma-70 family)
MLPAAAIQSDEGLIALNDALVELAKLDPLKAQVVDLKYFGGFSVEEIAEMLEMSPTSVKRYWSVARAFLYNELKSKGG